MPAHNVLLFGGSGAGKTTLLASMLDLSTQRILDNRLSLKIYPDDSSDNALITAKEVLEYAFVEEPFETPFNLLSATKGIVPYRIHASRAGGSSPDLTIDFIDTPGELSQDLSPKLKEQFKDTRAAILVIDTVELFFGEGIHPQIRRNSPDKAHRLIQLWLQARPTQNLLLCIVPVKTETWLRSREGAETANGAKLVTEKILSKYDRLLTEMSLNKERAAVLLCPIQTVGNLVFDRYEAREAGYPDQFWKKIHGYKTEEQPPTGYAPVDADQPLRHIFSWLLIEEIARRRAANQTWFSKFVRSVLKELDEEFAEFYDEARTVVLDLFGSDRELAKAVSIFVSGAKRDAPFRVIQGEDLITRESLIWDLFA